MHFIKQLTSKALALLLLAAVAMLVFVSVVEPLAGSFRDLRERIASERELLGRLNAAARNGGQDLTGASQRAGKTSELFLAGTSDAVRMAELQSLLGRIAKAEGVELKSTRSLPASERHGVRLIGIEANLSATFEQLQRILHELEGTRPYLFVESLRVTPPPLLSAENPDAGAALEVRISVAGGADRKRG